jgi:hypothetical protein
MKSNFNSIPLIVRRARNELKRLRSFIPAEGFETFHAFMIEQQEQIIAAYEY